MSDRLEKFLYELLDNQNVDPTRMVSQIRT